MISFVKCSVLIYYYITPSKLIAIETLIFFMTNSDYLLKAAIKKVTEKLNEILVEKIEEATNIAQDAPVILKKEFDSLKESIIEEASRLEKAENNQEIAV